MNRPISVARSWAGAALALAALLSTPLWAAEIVTSPSDSRSYRALTLDNGLKVVLISDPSTDMAAASLSVNVGSGSNPPGREGLAHFLEHMLFLGTEKYPRAGEYKDFITRHGGSDNAYTAFDETNYFFEIEAGYLEPALDRFSQFFVAPLFNPEFVARERQVVHSEYLGRKDSDGLGALSAVRTITHPDHPFSAFSVGSLDTLADRPGSPVRDELIAFYRRHYSASLMALAILGREPLATLEAWARQRFSAVPNHGASALDIRVPLFRPGTLPARLHVVPERERRSLALTFPVPAVRPHWRSKPVAHIAHLLGHEGQGSLLAELKRRSWAQGLSAGLNFEDPSGAAFNVRVQLTEKGLEHADAIIALVFRYLQLIRERGVERWVFEENRKLADIDFRFHEKPSPLALARRLASLQHEYPQHEVLRGPYAYDEYRPQLVHAYLDQLTPDNVLVTVVAPGLDTDRVTPRYDTRYRLLGVDRDAVALWQRAPADATLAIPAANPFIPENLTMLGGSGSAIPEERVSVPGFRLWHQQDTDYGLPKADFFLSLRSPLANASPRNALLTRLYVDLVNDQLNAFAYPAQLAGLSFHLYTHMRGLSVRISGYDDRQAVLLERILATLARPRIDAERFRILKAELKRGLLNSRRSQPYRRAMSRLRDLLVQPSWTVLERLAVIDGISSRELEDFVPRLLARVSVVALAHGNVDAGGARALGDRVREALVAPATPQDVPRGRVARLRRGDRLSARLEVEHPESALVLYLQGLDKSIETRARAGLLAQVLSSPFFDQLRTKQELGYVVFANAYPVLDTAGLVFTVQSPTLGAAELGARVRAFIDGYREQLESLGDAALEQHKTALVARIMEEERQLSERSDRYWTEIDRENLRFDTRERLAEAVKAIDAQDFRRFYRSMLTAPTRRELAVLADGAAGAGARSAALGIDVNPTWLMERRSRFP